MTRRPKHMPPPPRGDDVPVCNDCGHQHLTKPHGTQACIRHKSHRDDAGQLVPCSKPPEGGGQVCGSHGARASQVQAANRRRLHTVKVEGDIRAALTHEGLEQVTEDPCQCHQSFASVSPTHRGHCCFVPAWQTCHPAEVAAWKAKRDQRVADRARALTEDPR